MPMKVAALPVRAAPRRPTLTGVFRLFFARRELARQHQALLRLDDRLLSDIGLTRAEALRGADEARWDAPAHWFGDD
jgi:uncharacterized protein YjiS (DUF1127 family)